MPRRVLVIEDNANDREPVTTLTASEDPALNRHAYAAGAQACILKPLREEALLVTLETALAGMRRETSS
ncbi:MAG TPA: hypothetical protein VLH58_03095 [Candidatus Methylomirabilis sp.]|nr:hypothetical protein [Candidatus Methylomirabilis sp.]